LRPPSDHSGSLTPHSVTTPAPQCALSNREVQASSIAIGEINLHVHHRKLSPGITISTLLQPYLSRHVRLRK